MGDTLKSWLLLQLDTTLDSLNNHAGSLISLNSFLSLNSNPKRVQISQLSNISDSSLSCIVSDKVLLISSVITADAALTLAEALVNENKPVKKLSGGIFLIKKFKFLLHDEKDMLSIKLIIHDLEYIGSEGCNLFGDPKTISSFPSIKQKLLDLDKSIQVGTIIVENSGGPRRYKIGQHPQWKDSFDFEVPIDEREKLNELLPERIFNWSQINSLKRSASFGTLPDSSTEFYSAEFPTIKKQFSSTQVQKSDNLECLVKSHSTSSQVLKSDNQKNATLIAKSHSQPAPTVDKKIDNNKAIFSIESDSESDSEKHLVKNTPAEPSVPFVYKLPKKKVVNETSAVCNSQELMQFVEESSQMSDNNNKDSFQSSFHSQEFLATSTQLLVSVEQDKISKVDKTHDSVSMDILLSNSADPIELSLQNSESILSNSAEDPLQKSASLESIFEFQSQEFATDRVNDDIMDEGNTQFFNAEESISSFSKVLQTQDFIDDPISQMSNVMELSNESPLKVRPEDEDDYASQIDSDKEGVEYLEVAEEVLTASFSKETDLDEIQVRKDPSSTSSDSCNSFMEDTQEGGNQGLIGSFVNGLIDTFSFKGKKSDIETVNKDEANDTISNAKDSSIEFLPGVDLKSIEKMDIYSGNFAKSVEPVEKSEISNTNLIVGVDRHLITETTGFDHVFEDSAAVYALKHFSFNLALVVLVSGTQFEEDFDMEDVADVHHPPFFDDDEDDGISDEKVVEKDCLMERPDESIQDKEPEPLKCLVQIKDQQLKTALESPNITTRKRNKVADFFSDSSESSLEKLVDIQKTEKVEISDEELSEELSEYEPAKEDVSSVKLIIGKSPLPSKLSAKLDDVASNSDSDHQLVLKFKNRKVIHTSSSSDSENLMQISRKKPILDTIIDESESQQESSDSDDTSKSCVDSSDSEVLLLNHLNTIKRPDRKSISRQNSNVSPNRSNKLEVSNPANEISRKSIEMPKALVRSRESSIEAPKRHTLLFSETAFEPRSQKIEPEKRNPSFGNKQGAMKKANIVDSDSDDVKIAHKSLTEPYKRFSGKLGDLKESVVSSDSEDLKPISRHKSLDSQSNKRKISWPNQEVDLKKKRVVSVEKRSSNVRYFGGVEESIGDVEKETKGEPEKRSNGLWPVRYSIPTLDEALEAYIENAVADLPEYILF